MTAADALDVDLAPLVSAFWAPLLPASVARWVVGLSMWVLTINTTKGDHHAGL